MFTSQSYVGMETPDANTFNKHCGCAFITGSNGTSKNYPIDYLRSYLLYYNLNDTYKFQLFVNCDVGDLNRFYIRVCYGSGGWSTWREL